MIIAKHFEFEACHQLPNMECYGACRNLHGHTYKLTIEISGPINEKGWVINFKDLKAIVGELIINKYDHANLNDFFEVSTAENMVAKMYKDLKNYFNASSNRYPGITVHSVKLYETSNSYVYIDAGCL